MFLNHGPVCWQPAARNGGARYVIVVHLAGLTIVCGVCVCVCVSSSLLVVLAIGMVATAAANSLTVDTTFGPVTGQNDPGSLAAQVCVCVCVCVSFAGGGVLVSLVAGCWRERC